MESFFIKKNITIYSALKKLKETGSKCLVVTDGNLKLLGTLTDGDIRKAIVEGKNLDYRIDKIYNRKPKFINKKKMSNLIIRDIFLKFKLDLIPIVENKKIIDIMIWSDFFSGKKTLETKKISVVIMAGGKGSRLHPFSKVLPKPLVPVNEIPIIEIILEKFLKYNILDIFISINYKSKILISYLKTTKFYKRIQFISEKNPMGTIGSLALLKNKKLSKNFFVANCDVVINTDYKSILDFHENKKNDITIVCAIKKIKIPYGTCEINKNGTLIRMLEKPEIKKFINVGLYVLNKSIFSIIGKNDGMNFDELLKKAKKNRKKIGIFPIEDSSWFDFGQWDEYEKSINEIKK